MAAADLLADAALDLGSSPSRSVPRDSIYYDDRLSSPAFFGHRSHGELRFIDGVIKIIRRRLTKKHDLTNLANVYVLQARDTHMVKVGYTTEEDLNRVETIMRRCKVNIYKMFDTPSFHGAFRTEQIVHRLLQQWGYNRYDCPCGKHTNREWFGKPFAQVVGVVQMVYGWIMNGNPYDDKGDLRHEWKTALSVWRQSQETREPLEWIDFFLLNQDYMRGRQMFVSRSLPSTPASHLMSATSSTATSRRRGGLYRLHTASNDQSSTSYNVDFDERASIRRDRATENTPTRVRRSSHQSQHINHDASTEEDGRELISPLSDIGLAEVLDGVARRLFPDHRHRNPSIVVTHRGRDLQDEDETQIQTQLNAEDSGVLYHGQHSTSTDNTTSTSTHSTVTMDRSRDYSPSATHFSYPQLPQIPASRPLLDVNPPHMRLASYSAPGAMRMEIRESPRSNLVQGRSSRGSHIRSVSLV